MHRGLLDHSEDTSRLAHDVGASLAPRNLIGVADGVELDLVAVNDEGGGGGIVVNGALVLAVGRVVLEKVRSLQAQKRVIIILGGGHTRGCSACSGSKSARRLTYSTSQKGSLTATTVAPSFMQAALQTRRPMRPKPEMPIFTMSAEWCVWKVCDKSGEEKG
eukprot:scaffold53064_cov32-Tisochrysis_lutea.AAC.2